jgi:adenylate cyclase
MQSQSLSLLPADDAQPINACMVALSADGWSMMPVVDWLFGPGCQAKTLPALVQGLADCLAQAGAPIMRLRLGLWAIHPQQAAYAYNWTRANPKVEILNVGHGIFESPDFIGSPAEVIRKTGKPVRYKLDQLDPAVDHSVLFSVRDAGGTDYLGLPMLTFTDRVDSLFLVTDRDGGFSASDIAKFRLLARMLLPVVEALGQHQLSVNVLNTYLGERAGRRVLSGKIRRGDGEPIDAALWYCDLRDFTAMSEKVEERAMLGLMNRYFEHIHESVTAYGGEVLRFIGDAMLIAFPCDKGQSRAAACDSALSAALDAIDRLPSLNVRLKRAGLPEIRFGIGLHVGHVLYGNVGAENRLDFTVMGPAVNRTSRIESLTKKVGVPVLASQEFADLLADHETGFEAVGAFAVNGIAEELMVCKPCALG